jgi:oligoribonuclease (3'-5' exoribonuclease)
MNNTYKLVITDMTHPLYKIVWHPTIYNSIQEALDGLRSLNLKQHACSIHEIDQSGNLVCSYSINMTTLTIVETYEPNSKNLVMGSSITNDREVL